MLKDIVSGLQAYFASYLLIKKLRLRKYFLVPVFLSFCVGVLILWSSYYYAETLGSYISQIWIFETGKELFNNISTFIGGLVIFVFGFLFYKHIVLALAAPFMSPVSEKIENYYYEEKGLIGYCKFSNTSSFLTLLFRGVRINFRNLLKELLITIPLLGLSIIPVVNFITTPILFLIQSYYAGFGSMDYTLERHFKYKESISFVKANKGVAIGNGIVFMLMLLIPFVGFIIVLPLSVTASSLRTIEKIHFLNFKEVER